MSLNFGMSFLPNMGLQQNNSYGNYATATASSGSSYASASASSGSTGLFDGGFNQINNAIGNQCCNQDGMIQMFMQFIMQLIQQMFGNKGNQQCQNSTNQNPLQNNQNAFPFVSPNASANAAASPYGATANASAGGANAFAQVGGNADSNLLNKVSQAERDAVKGKDLGAVDKNGYPQYLISKAKDGQYHIYEQKGNTKGKTYKSVTKVKSGSNYLHVKDPAKNKAAAAAASTNNGGSFASSFAYNYNPTTGQASFAGAFAYSDSASSGALENKGGGKTGSPLILDTNKDGKVSAQQGMGVDVNGDGKADGAATGGDKMLAMGDIDGDGQITGKEVFGNETVDPFTGQKVNAANGFDALAKVAKSAEQHTGIKCVDENGEVDLQKLKQAMEQSGKGSLGMISGNNTTKLEGLGDASKINTNNYSNHNESGLVQHNQQGSYTDANGQKHSIHDIWFQLA